MNASSSRLTARRAWLVPALAAILLLVLAGARSASAATDPHAPGPFECSSSFAFVTMLPSLFQGADGDQCDSTGALTTPGSYDWQELVADGRFGAGGGGMARIDDDTVPGSIYKDGSQEFGPLGWDYDANLGGQKTNLLAAWGHPDQLTDLYLYLAFAATDAPGTVRYGFELNRLAAVPSGASAVNHPNYFLNSKGHWVLKRSLDDVLIIFNWQGGAAATIERCYWKPESGPNPPPIHEAGIWSGCQDLTALAEAQGRGNGDGDKNTDDTITNFLPGLAAGELAENQFGELAVNLTDALDVGGVNQPKCLSFGSFWMKTLPGNSLNSSLKDLIPPHPVSITNCGKVIIRKATAPSTDATSFDFDGAGFKAEADGQQGGSPGDFDLSHGESETIDKVEPSSALPAGTDYTVTENLPAGFTLRDIECTETGATVTTTTPSVKDVANRRVTLKVDPGETVDCTFENRKQGTILIDKDQVGGSDTDAFSFTRGGDLASGSFTQSESEAGPESISVVPNLGAGGDTSKTYTITEDATGQPAGYGLEDVTCYDGATTGDPVDTDRVVSGQSVDVKVAAGETVLCVFRNVKSGTILIDKDQVGGSDTDAFSFTRGGDLVAGSFTQSQSEAGPESISVAPNLGAGGDTSRTYTVTEDATGQPAGYDFKDLVCYDGSSTSHPVDTDRVITGQSVAVKVAAGATVLCVYRNVKRATILIDKDQVGGSDTDAFSFTRGGDLVSGSFTQAESEAGPESITVEPNLGTASSANTYTVTEDATGQPAGYDFKDVACYDGATTADPVDADRVIAGRSVDVKVAAGATVLCVYRNVKRATILVQKDQVGGSDADVFNFTAGGDLTPAGAFGQSEAQAAESFTVVPNLGAGSTANTYTVTEDATGQPSGYDFKDIACYDGATTSASTDADRVVSGRSVDVKVEAGQTVLCVFRNVKRATILVDKDQVGGADSDAFTFTRGGDLSAGSFTQAESEASPESISVAPNLGTGSTGNTYTIAEDATGQPAGYELRGIACHDGSSTSDPADTDGVITGRSVSVEVEPGATVLCVFQNVKQATILVQKDQVGGSDGDVFQFTAGGDLTPAGGFGQSEAQAAESFTVAPNLGTASTASTYTVTEDALGQPAGYDLEDVTCHDGATTGDPVDADRVVAGRSVNVRVAAGATVLCVFRNVKRATILIDKDQVGGSDADAFTFTRGGDLSAGSFAQSAAEAGPESISVAPNLGTAATTNTYTVTEDATGQPAGYDFKDVTCYDGSSTSDPVDTDRVITGRSVAVRVAAGQTVLCVYRNVKQATILVQKDQVGGSDSDVFNFTAGGDLTPAGAFGQSEGQAAESFAVVPNLGTGSTANTYTVTEDAAGQPSGYDFKDVACYDGSTTSAPADTDRVVNGRSVNVNVAAGQTVLCVFRNVKRSTILIDKDQVGGADADAFSFTRGGDLAAGSFTQAESEAAPESITVAPNLGTAADTSQDYAITEDAAGQPAGYDFRQLTCYDGSTTAAPIDADRVVSGQSVGVKVAAGATVLCVFQNVRRSTILVRKDQVGGSDTDVFNFTASNDLTSAGSFTQSEAQAAESFTVVPNLGAGSTANAYTVTEDATGQPAGYDFQGIACYDGATTGAPADGDSVVSGRSVSVMVAAGETVLCVYTNVKQARLVVEKQTDPDETGGATFDFTTAAPGGPSSFALADDQQSSRDLSPGTYTVTEAAKAGYRLSGIDCDDGDSTQTGDAQALSDREATFVLAAGETVTCTFTNTKIDAAAVVVKSGNELAYHGDSVTFDFEVTNPGNSPLHDVVVTDDKCPSVSGPVKQVNGGGADDLDPGDKWVYTCTMPIPDHADGEANPLRNVVTVAARDEQGSPVSATDDHLTRILHPAIEVDKTGPAEGVAGTAVEYAIAVTNPGDVAFAADRVAVQDQLCEAPPLLNADGKRRGDGPDPTPDSLDPGDTWLYACTVRTALGQQRVDNVADVAATDFNGRTVSDADPAATVLRQPIVQSAPQRAQPGSARLQGPAACVHGAFRVTVRGRQIASVTLFVGKRRVRTLRAQQAIVLRNTKRRVLVDGKVKTVTVAQAQQTFRFSIDPRRLSRGGVHRVSARVVFTTASGTESRRLRFAFRRCQAARQPRFTG